MCFVKFVSGRCSRILVIMSYFWISLLLLNKCLLLRVNIIIKNIYCKLSVIMRKFLKFCLQESLSLVLVIILIIFFCNVNTLYTIGEVPQKIKPYDIMEWAG
jgi:hypothetical protein